MKIKPNSRSYLDWEDYVKIIQQKEMLDFQQKTARESFLNLLSKEV